jgi:hypothetical protein
MYFYVFLIDSPPSPEGKQFMAMTCECGGQLKQETPEEQVERIYKGMKNLFSGDEKSLRKYAQNYVGQGSKDMYVCDKCGRTRTVRIQKPKYWDLRGK